MTKTYRQLEKKDLMNDRVLFEEKDTTETIKTVSLEEKISERGKLVDRINVLNEEIILINKLTKERQPIRIKNRIIQTK